MIKAIIIDDEPRAGKGLAILIEKHCPEIELVAICQDSRKAIDLIQELQPQLVFLDVEMPHMNGFELLEKLLPASFEVIFTTSYDQYAIKAIKFSALDYLLKPVGAGELQTAVKKFQKRSPASLALQVDILLSQLRRSKTVPNRIALSTMEGLQIIAITDIICCSASGNYTILTLKNNQKLTVSRQLKDIEEMLGEESFMRVHHSYLVNLEEIKKYTRGEGGSLLMSDGSIVDVSRTKKEMLLHKLQPER